jgi:hypothetical protein
VYRFGISRSNTVEPEIRELSLGSGKPKGASTLTQDIDAAEPEVYIKRRSGEDQTVLYGLCNVGGVDPIRSRGIGNRAAYSKNTIAASGTQKKSLDGCVEQRRSACVKGTMRS